jgi:hypothetical protein
MSKTVQIDLIGALNFQVEVVKLPPWIWKASEARLGPLKKLAEDSTVTAYHKKKGIQRLARDVFGLLKSADGSIDPFEGTERGKLLYQNLYKLLRGRAQAVSKNFSSSPKLNRSVVGFPSYIFSDPHATQFGAQEFLRLFLEENKSELTICPACDEVPYSISAGKIYINTGDKKIEADIDHYLPKTSYPHLSCHPFNLVPTCPFCNQRKKRDKDPLAKNVSGISSRRNLNEIYQLYREEGSVNNTYLEINFSDSYKTPQIVELIPKSGCNLREILPSIREIYQIPDGWQEPSEKQAASLSEG